ncbi:hypothetical protein IAT40_007566 [Kwoniella sp. CBS 6097]
MSEPLQVILSNLPRRLNDIETFQLPRLKGCLGPLDLHRELVDEMRGDLDAVRYKLEVAQELYDSVHLHIPNSEREVYHSQLNELNHQYNSLKTSFRSAMIESKRNIVSRRSRVHELSERNKRYELDSKLNVDGNNGGVAGEGEGEGSLSKRDTRARSAAEIGMGGDDELQTKTNEVTTALRRTTALMQTELERSVLSVQMLDSSTQTLLSTSTLYDNYTSLLVKSGQLVKIIEKADTLDRIIILSALLFFLLVVGFIVKRRVIDRTLGVVVGGVGRGVGWYLFGTGKLVRLAFGGGGGGKKGQKVAVQSGPGSGSESGQLNQDQDQDQDQDHSGIAIGIGSATPVIGSDSAITPQLESEEKGTEKPEQAKEQDMVVGIDIGPGHIPHKEQPYDASNRGRGGKGGKVEIIANGDTDMDRIKPSCVDPGPQLSSQSTQLQGRSRDEL